MNHLLDNCQTWDSDCHWRVNNSSYILYATRLHFAPGGQVCLSNISLLFIQYTGPSHITQVCVQLEIVFQVSVMVHVPLAL